MARSDERVRAGVGEEVVGGIALILIASIFLFNAGEGLQDWLFPIALATTLVLIGVGLIVWGIARPTRTMSLIPPIFRGRGIDVAVFIGLGVIYVALIRTVGFWVMSAIMIFAVSMYLAVERSWRVALTSAVVGIAVVLVAHYVMLEVFYVPLPRSRWIPSF